MEIGLLFTFRNPPPWQRNNAELYRSTLDEIELADALGFDGIWLAEHHFTDDGWSPSPLTLAAAVAARTGATCESVRSCCSCPSITRPSGGGGDCGRPPLQWTAHPRSGHRIPGRRGARASDWIRRHGVTGWTRRSICSSGPLRVVEVSFDGRYYKVDGVEISPRPVQEPRPPILTAGAGRRALERSVRARV